MCAWRASVILSVGVALPGGESLERFVAHHLDHGNFSLVAWPAQLLVNKGIIKAGVRGILRRACEEDARRTRPMDLAFSTARAMARCMNWSYIIP
jgi:hypothetical protein